MGLVNLVQLDSINKLIPLMALNVTAIKAAGQATATFSCAVIYGF
jgi:hypothetical protein